MRFRRLLLGAVIALPLALAGCKINTINSFNASPAQIRVANVVPDAPAIAVSVDGTQAWNGVKFEAVTAYQPFTADVHDFGVRIDGTPSDLIITPVQHRRPAELHARPVRHDLVPGAAHAP